MEETLGIVSPEQIPSLEEEKSKISKNKNCVMFSVYNYIYAQQCNNKCFNQSIYKSFFAH